jgi:hypothetical protein
VGGGTGVTLLSPAACLHKSKILSNIPMYLGMVQYEPRTVNGIVILSENIRIPNIKPLDQILSS